MIWNLIRLLLSQTPLFWFSVAMFFFVIGVLWANACWGRYRIRLMAAENEQLFLVAEREEVFASRERRLRQSTSTEEVRRPRVVRFDDGGELAQSSSTDIERTSPSQLPQR